MDADRVALVDVEQALLDAAVSGNVVAIKMWLDRQAARGLVSPVASDRPPAGQRLEGEPARWYARFVTYRDLGPDRSLALAYARHRSARQSTAVPALWYDAAEDWRWRERADEWDKQGGEHGQAWQAAGADGTEDIEGQSWQAAIEPAGAAASEPAAGLSDLA